MRCPASPVYLWAGFGLVGVLLIVAGFLVR
jgi:hypothetical protein